MLLSADLLVRAQNIQDTNNKMNYCNKINALMPLGALRAGTSYVGCQKMDKFLQLFSQKRDLQVFVSSFGWVPDVYSK